MHPGYRYDDCRYDDCPNHYHNIADVDHFVRCNI